LQGIFQPSSLSFLWNDLVQTRELTSDSDDAKHTINSEGHASKKGALRMLVLMISIVIKLSDFSAQLLFEHSCCFSIDMCKSRLFSHQGCDKERCVLDVCQ